MTMNKSYIEKNNYFLLHYFFISQYENEYTKKSVNILMNLDVDKLCTDLDSYPTVFNRHQTTTISFEKCWDWNKPNPNVFKVS